MIGRIGFSRVVMLFAIILMAALLGAFVYLFLLPEKERMQQSFNTIKGSIQKKEGQIQQIENDFAYYRQKKNEFKKLEENEFFYVLEKEEIRLLFETFKSESAVNTFTYSVSPPTVLTQPSVRGSGHELLERDITITAKSMDDIDVFILLHLIEQGLPGQKTLQEFKLNRIKEMGVDQIRAIGSGTSIDLIGSSMKFKWRVMNEEPEKETQSQAGAGGRRR